MGRSAKAVTIEVEKILRKFSLEKYAACNELTLTDWFYQLILRQTFWIELQEPGAQGEKKAMSTALKLLKAPLDFGKKDGSFDGHFGSVVKSLSIDHAWSMKSAIEEALPVISARLENYHEHLQSADYAGASSAYPRQADSPFDSALRVWATYPDNSCNSLAVNLADNVCYVAVDLMAPNKVIVERFSEWLRTKRIFHSKDFKSVPGKYFSDKDRQSWVRNMILPCLDLILVATSHNTKINDATLAGALYPKGARARYTDRVRRTTRPQALAMMDTESLWKLLRSAENSDQANNHISGS